MDSPNHYNPLLELLEFPAFLVQENYIVQANAAAKGRLITPGTSIDDILDASREVYHKFTSGSLYLTLSIKRHPCGATVSIANDMHLFCLDQYDQADRALALAAAKLRSPIHTLFAASEPFPQEEVFQHHLFQLHRMVTNMADYPKYLNRGESQFENMDAGWVFAEIVDKCRTLLEKAGIKLHYSALPQCVVMPIDEEMLERAVYNLISNAAKYSPAGGTVDIKLSASDACVYFTIQDQGPGIPQDILSSLFNRYLRFPGIEDSRHGIGLGLPLVKVAAARHNGTVLIEQPECGGTRVTMTLALPSDDTILLRSTVMTPKIDYAGGKDHGLLELCDVLPSNSYKNI